MPGYTSTDTTRQSELAAFLRSRRSRIRPEDVGLPKGFRRRTPGLRREEVAQLAGVGLTWYTWLEQGREINVSPLVLCSVARVLKLEPAERVHLFHLAGQEPPPASVSEVVGLAHTRVVENWEPFPARITGRRWDVLAWNRAAMAVFGDYGALPEGRRNTLWAMFMREDWRALADDWPAEAERCVAQFRSQAAPHLDDPAFQSLLAELNELCPDFRDLWARQDVRGRTDGLKRLHHPTLGILEMEYSTYQIGDQPGLSMCLFTPLAGSRTESILRGLDLDAYGPPGVRTETAEAVPAV